MIGPVVYVVAVACIGPRTNKGRLPHYAAEYADYRAYRSLDMADEVALTVMDEHGGGFTPNASEAKPDHVIRAYSNGEHVVWVEQLGLVD